MAKNKTVETDASVADYLKNISDDKRREDCSRIITVISKATGLPARMWGTGIVGFGSYHYKYASGHEGEAPCAGLASRSNAIALYLADNPESKAAHLKMFGKHKTSKGCVYIQKIEDIDIEVLAEMAISSVRHYRELYPS